LLAQDTADAAARQTQLVVSRAEVLERSQLVFDCIEDDLAHRKEHLLTLAGEIPENGIVVLVQPPKGWEALAKEFPHPERLIGLQLTEFPSLLRRGQLLPLPNTAKSVTVEVTNLLLRCGIILDTDGLAAIPIMNRLYGAVAREACEILREQNLAPAQLDEVIRTLVGPMLTAMGPMEYIADVGLDAAFATILSGKVSTAATDHLRTGGPDKGPLPLPESAVGEDGLPVCMLRLSRIQMNLT
jgi:hypothetical protein